MPNTDEATTHVWYSSNTEKWHWTLTWEDGSPYGTHMHHGIAESEQKAKEDISKTLNWIHKTWPSEEYYNGI